MTGVLAASGLSCSQSAAPLESSKASHSSPAGALKLRRVSWRSVAGLIFKASVALPSMLKLAPSA